MRGFAWPFGLGYNRFEANGSIRASEEGYVKALVLEAYNKFVYQDVPEPEMGAEDVLIEVAACGICGSDVHGMDGSSGRRIPPIIMGHEAAGTIAQVGAKVTGWQVGGRRTRDREDRPHARPAQHLQPLSPKPPEGFALSHGLIGGRKGRKYSTGNAPQFLR